MFEARAATSGRPPWNARVVVAVVVEVECTTSGWYDDDEVGEWLNFDAMDAGAESISAADLWAEMVVESDWERRVAEEEDKAEAEAVGRSSVGLGIEDP